jgi:hypothetical protein
MYRQNRATASSLLSMLLLVQTPSLVEQATPPVPEVLICGGMMPRGLAAANTTVQLVYEVSTDSGGNVQRVRTLKNTIVPEQPLVACLKRWRLPVANSSARISMRWEHARGWTTFIIAFSDGTTRRLAMDPGWPW